MSRAAQADGSGAGDARAPQIVLVLMYYRDRTLPYASTGTVIALSVQVQSTAVQWYVQYRYRRNRREGVPVQLYRTSRTSLMQSGHSATSLRMGILRGSELIDRSAGARDNSEQGITHMGWSLDLKSTIMGYRSSDPDRSGAGSQPAP